MESSVEPRREKECVYSARCDYYSNFGSLFNPHQRDFRGDWTWRPFYLIACAKSSQIFTSQLWYLRQGVSSEVNERMIEASKQASKLISE